MPQPNTQPKGKTQAAAPPARPFRTGVQTHEENNYDQTVTVSSSTQDLPVFELPPQGFLQGVVMFVQINSANS